MSDPLDPSAVISTLPNLLPPDAKTLKNQYDGLAALLHAVMHIVGFRLVGLDETSPAEEVTGNILPESWNKNGPDSYAFRYKHDQSSMVFFLKIVKLGTRSLIHGIALETDKAQSLDILSSDYLSAGSFPYTVDSSSGPLIHGFISSGRIKDLLSLYRLNILQKLAPGLRKEGYEDTSETSNAPAAERAGSSSTRQPNPRNPAPDHPDINPYGQRSPTYNDPLRIPNVGRSDLDPIPRNPFSPPSLFGNEDDGMFVGPNHPLFRGRGGGGGGGIGGIGGPWGGDGFLPPMGAPPGARFDPIGPGPFGGLPRGGPPGRGGPFGGPFGPGNPPRGYRGGDPDNDEFMPPGADDMYS